MFQMKVVSQNTINHYVKGGDAEKYEDRINICSFVETIRNWDMTCDYFVSGYIIGWNQVIMYKYYKIFLVVKFNLIVVFFFIILIT